MDVSPAARDFCVGVMREYSYRTQLPVIGDCPACMSDGSDASIQPMCRCCSSRDIPSCVAMAQRKAAIGRKWTRIGRHELIRWANPINPLERDGATVKV